MVDGIFDLLTAILLLGIVAAIAFDFILPLQDDAVMQYSTEDEDKALVGNMIDYSNPSMFSDITERKYTGPELCLLLYVQNSRIPNPKSIYLGAIPNSSTLNTALTNKTLEIGETYPLEVDDLTNLIANNCFKNSSTKYSVRYEYAGKNGVSKEVYAIR